MRVPREAREGLAPQDNPRVEVQEQDLGREAARGIESRACTGTWTPSHANPEVAAP